jgi:hypothetical protein
MSLPGPLHIRSLAVRLVPGESMSLQESLMEAAELKCCTVAAGPERHFAQGILLAVAVSD